jgi:hypothetical protein
VTQEAKDMTWVQKVPVKKILVLPVLYFLVALVLSLGGNAQSQNASGGVDPNTLQMKVTSRLWIATDSSETIWARATFR